MGAASFQIAGSSDILATLSASNQSKVLITIVNILFPIAVLVTSVPVFAIVIRYNLVRGDFCSNSKTRCIFKTPRLLLILRRMGNRVGKYCAMVSNNTVSDQGTNAITPFTKFHVNVLLQGWLILVMNWTSLIFGSSTYFIIPLVLYISSKTSSASTVDTTGERKLDATCSNY
jgi:hypothetical protein